MHVRNCVIRILLGGTLIFSFFGCSTDKKDEGKFSVRPNILLLMSDNQYYKHLGCYGDTILETPNIDKIAKEGIRFTNAFCQSPSCSPARAAMLTGKNFWTLRQAANLWSSFPSNLIVFPDLLKDSGYLVGSQGKSWGPGNYKVTGWKNNPGGKKYSSFEEFYNNVDPGQPWFYWFSSRRPARPFGLNSGKESGIDPKDIFVPPFLPDNDIVRNDIADYYNEIDRFDKEVGHIISLVNEMGQLENTVIIICSDNGWQMPRGLANLYDYGTQIPLIISWPKHLKKDDVDSNFVLLNDLGPTILDLADVPIPKEMTARSLLSSLYMENSGDRDQDKRNYVILGRERHAFARKNGLGYPERAIRTNDFLYIYNFKPDRWPAGDPPLYGDVDANNMQYPAPTKMYMLQHKGDSDMKGLFELSFGKRPREELYDLSKDKYQMNNVANDKEYEKIKNGLHDTLFLYLEETRDPRIVKEEFDFDTVEYYMDADKNPQPSDSAIIKLGLKPVYHYLDDK